MNWWRPCLAVLLLTCAIAVTTPHAEAGDRYGLLYTLLNPNTNAQANAHQGTRIALQDNIAVVAASVDDVGGIDSGVVRIYDVSTGSLLHTLFNPTPAADEHFGASVAISGTRVVVGTPYDLEAAYAGTAYIYDLASLTPTVPVLILTNPYPAGGDSFGISVAISGERVVVGAQLDDTGARDAGSAYVYNLSSITPAVPIVTLTNPGPAESDWYGSLITISGSYVAVGAQLDDTGAANAGSVYVYNLASVTPMVPSMTITNPKPAADDRFGAAIAISGTRMIVGAFFDDEGATNAGAAYLFDMVGVNPTVPVRTFTNPAPNADDLFGGSVALSDTYAVIGAGADDFGATNSGIAYVYDLTGPNHATPVITLANPSPGDSDVFGAVVAVSGSRLAITAHGDSTLALSAGAVYIYDLAGTNPDVVVAMLSYPSPTSSDWFGYSVAISGTRCVIGAAIDDTGAMDTGIAYIYDLAGPINGRPMLTLTNPSPMSQERFASAVAIDGSRVVVGAHGDGTGASRSGIAYVYDLNGALPSSPTLTLTNPTPAPDDFFGYSLAISGTRVVVGADNDSAGATFAGSAYVYDLASLTPAVPVLTLTNPAPQPFDNFGYAVAISGRWLVVGANSDDTGALDAGSAYVYDLDGPAPAQVFLTLTNPTPTQSDSFGDAVAVSGTRIVISASGDDTGAISAGIAYVYDLSSPMAAVPVLTLTNPSPAYGDYFGDSVAISGTRLVIGVLFADIGAIDSGAAYVYDLTSFTPAVPVAMFTNPTPGLYDEFGDWVAIDGSNIIVGAHSDDTGAFDRGAAYVFSLVPALSITPVAPDSVTISWAPSSTSFMLQCSDSLMDTNWSNAPSGSINPVTIPIAAQSRFYRLIRN